jgi:hypothetical protein
MQWQLFCKSAINIKTYMVTGRKKQRNSLIITSIRRRKNCSVIELQKKWTNFIPKPTAFLIGFGLPDGLLLGKQLTYSQIRSDVLHVKYSQQNALRALDRNHWYTSDTSRAKTPSLRFYLPSSTLAKAVKSDTFTHLQLILVKEIFMNQSMH